MLKNAAAFFSRLPRELDAFGHILVVVYTWREDNIRIISARKAVRYDVRQYEGEI